jgi:hypothetical protein
MGWGKKCQTLLILINKSMLTSDSLFIEFLLGGPQVRFLV